MINWIFNAAFLLHCITVAGSVVGLTAIQVPSKTPTLNISWSPPTTGAAVTRYSVYYHSSSSASDDIGHSDTNDTSVLIDELLANGRTYNISVVAHSTHFDGYSESIFHRPCKSWHIIILLCSVIVESMAKSIKSKTIIMHKQTTNKL